MVVNCDDDDNFLSEMWYFLSVTVVNYNGFMVKEQERSHTPHSRRLTLFSNVSTTRPESVCILHPDFTRDHFTYTLLENLMIPLFPKKTY